MTVSSFINVIENIAQHQGIHLYSTLCELLSANSKGIFDMLVDFKHVYQFAHSPSSSSVITQQLIIECIYLAVNP